MPPRSRAHRPGRAWPAAVAAGLVLAWPAHGASRLALQAASVEMSGLRAQAVALSADPVPGRALAFQVHVARIDGIEPLGAVSDLRLACLSLSVSPGRLACERGTASADLSSIGRQDSPWTFSLENGRDWQAALPALAIAGAAAALQAQGSGEDWSARLRYTAAQLERLASMPELASLVPAGMAVSGTASGQLDVEGSGGDLRALRLEASPVDLSFADEAGQLAAERLALKLGIRAAQAGPGGGWQLAATLAAGSGQAYLEPVFVDFGLHPGRLEFDGLLSPDGSALALSHFRLSQPGVGEVEGLARLDLDGDTWLRQARARLHGVDLSAAWPIYGAPWLIGTQWSDLVAGGRIDGELDLEDGAPARILLDLDGVALDSAGGSLAVQGLGGRFSWFSARLRDALAPGMDSEVFRSQLRWTSARLWGIEFGPVTVPFTTTGAHFRLLDRVTLPVFDGGLAIETLRLRHAGTPQMYLRFDAELTPVSLGLLTRSLGWPEFSGTLSGRIPRLELEEGFVTLGGNLEASVFDGLVTVRNLRLRDPLGAYPQLFADIDVDRLDLEQVTSTFEFGLITGRLSGRVEGLETFDWMPVAFDASFRTTPGDPSPRRIDQRAVSNLSSIGGGSGGSVAAALQGGFLRFFDSFRYRRLGMSCRLANDVCHMDGVAPAENGYYIVEGSGLPRIDVIGSQRRVAWTRLVRQLAAIAGSAGPVVD